MRFVGTKNKWIVAFVAMVFISTILTPSAQEEGTQNGEWPSYGGDLAHTRYSPLDQITGDNFNELEVAWSFRTDNFGPTPEFSLQSTPLMVTESSIRLQEPDGLPLHLMLRPEKFFGFTDTTKANVAMPLRGVSLDAA